MGLRYVHCWKSVNVRGIPKSTGKDQDFQFDTQTSLAMKEVLPGPHRANRVFPK